MPNILESPPFKARYLNRVPDPGVCTINSIDWRAKEVSMSNGAYCYFPSFDEIEIVEEDE